MRRVSHAGDRDDDRGRPRARAHVRVHHAGDDRQVRDAEPVHDVSRRQDAAVGARRALARPFSVADAMNPLSSIRWAEVEALGIRTTEDGPLGEDLFWHFVLRDGSIEIPGALVAEDELAEIDVYLAGLDYGNIIRATASTRERMFRIWHHVDSRYRPDRDALRIRFSALVARLGGNPDASAAFDGLYAAWSAESRRYHDLNHLVDCLREVDGANAPAATADLAELALWYHDAIYEAGAPDC